MISSTILLNQKNSCLASGGARGQEILNPTIIIYYNIETEKPQILSDNKGKTGIYQWKHKESGKIYIGSAVDLSSRLKAYYSVSNLKKWDNYISRALILHGYSAFNLSILEYINITGIPKLDLKTLILEREQHYLNSLEPEYNILKVAGSLLGFKHSEESLKNRSGVNHPNYGKPLSEKTKILISEALKGENNTNFGKTGEKHPMHGKLHSAETLALMSKVKTKESHPMFGKNHSAETKTKISLTLTKQVFLYKFDPDTKVTILYKTFNSSIEATKYFDCSRRTLSRYLDKKNLYKGEWALSTCLISKN